MILAIASGKGGTGKTTLAVNLARVIAGPVQLLDCDVEEPNAHLFLPGAVRERRIVGIPVPAVDAQLCNACGACARLCAWHAIVSFGTTPLVFPEMCHGCGGCALLCPRGAIREVERRIGEIEIREAGPITLISGRLDVGVATAPPLIAAVKAARRDGAPAILDAPPGTSCPVVATIRDADAVLLVTEPTPFGLHDLELAVATVRELGLPCGVVVNRMGSGDDRVQRWCGREGLPVLLEIPDDRRVAEAYSRGELMVDAVPEYRPLLAGLLDRAAELSRAARTP
jgi:MinD superfamily P-loop ATPase